jgi:hypothetical protein
MPWRPRRRRRFGGRRRARVLVSSFDIVFFFYLLLLLLILRTKLRARRGNRVLGYPTRRDDGDAPTNKEEGGAVVVVGGCQSSVMVKVESESFLRQTSVSPSTMDVRVHPLAGNRTRGVCDSRLRNEIPVHSPQFPPSERNSRPLATIPAFGTKFPSPPRDSLASIPAVGTKFPSPRLNSRLRSEIPVPSPQFPPSVRNSRLLSTILDSPK